MNILIHFPYNKRTVEQQSVMEMFVKNGHNVFLLTLAEYGDLHPIATSLGVKCYSTHTGENITIKNVITNTRVLIKFCKEHKIDVVFSHQQICAIPLIFSKSFIKPNVYYIRHNTDEGYKDNPLKAKFLNLFINRFVKTIIAPSNIVYEFLRKIEKVPQKKIIRINYGYNFEQYEKINDKVVSEIRNQFNCSLLIVSIARLVSAKRHIKMFNVVKSLINEGIDCKLICLGGGNLNADLGHWINENGMNEKIFLLGIKPNILDFLSAGNILMHLSETEASNSVVKEAGLAKRPSIVCKGVGDFEDYIISYKNGFLVDKINPEEETINILRGIYNNKEQLKMLGDNAHETVINTFTIKNVEPKYLSLINKNSNE